MGARMNVKDESFNNECLIFLGS